MTAIKDLSACNGAGCGNAPNVLYVGHPKQAVFLYPIKVYVKEN
jgi:hypothetical protein